MGRRTRAIWRGARAPSSSSCSRLQSKSLLQDSGSRMEEASSSSGQARETPAAATEPFVRLSKQEKKERKRQVRSQHRKEFKRKEERKRAKETKRRRNSERDQHLARLSLEEQRAFWQKLRQDKIDQVDRVDRAYHSGLRVAIDLTYADEMSSKERNSLARQLARCWSVNRKASAPLSLHICNLSKAPLDSVSCNASDEQHKDDFRSWKMHFHDDDVADVFSPSDLVFLSPDAEDAIDSFNQDKIYVIGGLVDCSPVKQQSLRRAHALGAQALRLPISENLTGVQYGRLPLTINGVVEIILHMNAGGKWRDALSQAVPLRKGSGIEDYNSRLLRRRAQSLNRKASSPADNSAESSLQSKAQDSSLDLDSHCDSEASQRTD